MPTRTHAGCVWPVLRSRRAHLWRPAFSRNGYGIVSPSDSPHWPPASPSDPGADPMGWHPPVPAAILDADNTEWQVIRSWPDDAAEDYVLELAAPGLAGVRAAHLRAGQLELLRDGRDRRLPALKLASPLGEVVVHRAHKRAVVRAGEHYLKIFRVLQADEAVGRHARMNELLGAEDFLTPDIVSSSPGCLTLMALPGRSLFELGNDPGVSDALFEHAWQEWSRAWVRQHSLARTPAHRPTLEALPPRPAAVELENLRHAVNRWLVH